MNSTGIMSFDIRSMPLRTPLTTTMWVMTRKIAAHKMGFTGWEENSWKYCFTYSASPLMPPTTAP